MIRPSPPATRPILPPSPLRRGPPEPPHYLLRPEPPPDPFHLPTFDSYLPPAPDQPPAPPRATAAFLLQRRCPLPYLACRRRSDPRAPCWLPPGEASSTRSGRHGIGAATNRSSHQPPPTYTAPFFPSFNPRGSGPCCCALPGDGWSPTSSAVRWDLGGAHQRDLGLDLNQEMLPGAPASPHQASPLVYLAAAHAGAVRPLLPDMVRLHWRCSAVPTRVLFEPRCSAVPTRVLFEPPLSSAASLSPAIVWKKSGAWCAVRWSTPWNSTTAGQVRLPLASNEGTAMASSFLRRRRCRPPQKPTRDPLHSSSP